MSAQAAPAGRRRHSAAGEATRELLMVTAERLFALNGVEGVALRQIQAEAGQSNTSVIAYHFGSKDQLVRALLAFRYRKINARRLELLRQAHDDGLYNDARAAVSLVVQPLLESIQAGEMFVPFLARVSANTRTLGEYLPFDDTTVDVLREMLPNRSSTMPDRVRLGREVQFYSSVLNFLGEHARGFHRIGAAQLNNYIDAWVGMLTAPVSPATAALMEQEEGIRKRRR